MKRTNTMLLLTMAAARRDARDRPIGYLQFDWAQALGIVTGLWYADAIELWERTGAHNELNFMARQALRAPGEQA